MGWLFGYEWDTKARVVEHLTMETEHTSTIAKALRGSTLWAVHERKADGFRWIGCYLLRTNEPGTWGYKDMDESMGPYDWSCPLKYLEMAPVLNEQWREGVRLRAAAKRRPFRIIGRAELDDDGKPLFWSNEFGWVPRAEADTFSLRDVRGERRLSLPIGGEWVRANY